MTTENPTEIAIKILTKVSGYDMLMPNLPAPDDVITMTREITERGLTWEDLNYAVLLVFLRPCARTSRWMLIEDIAVAATILRRYRHGVTTP